MLRVAVIAPSEEIARPLGDALRRHGMTAHPVAVTELPDGLTDMAYDAALVEVSLAGREALDLILLDKRLAERMAVLAALAPMALSRYLAGAPADDFVVWPAPSEELAARVDVAVRRRRGVEPEHILRFGDLAIDIANYRVTVLGQPVELTFKEYELLRFLASNRDKVFTREALLNRVWGYDYYGGARTVDVHIRRLRAKIEDGNRVFIETIRNVGYRFRKDDD
ncbi:MAG: response regulator transcription factor [Dehalococcoidia bacterium]